jgi:hypothetical protein
MRGLTLAKNPLGVVSIRAHYSLFPNHDPHSADPELAEEARAWLEKQRLRYLDPNDFQREMECSFDVTAGKRCFPEFSEQDHVLDEQNMGRLAADLMPRRRRRLLRSWDFGYHHPAVVIAQVDSRDRLILYGELQGRDLDIDRFAQKVIQYCADSFGDWSAWGYADYCDPAGAQVRSIMSEQSETTELQVLARYGIYPAYSPRPRKTGRAIIHQLLRERDDKSPALLVTRRCPIIISGMLGGYTYKMKTDGTYHDEPDDDGYFSHTQACLRYLVTNHFSNLAEHYGPGHGEQAARARTYAYTAGRRGGY